MKNKVINVMIYIEKQKEWEGVQWPTDFEVHNKRGEMILLVKM